MEIENCNYIYKRFYLNPSNAKASETNSQPPEFCGTIIHKENTVIGSEI